jgi:hypothetical protein
MLNEGLNNAQHEVQVIETAQEGAVARHLPRPRVAASSFRRRCLQLHCDRGISILVFLLVLLRVAYMPNADVGTICDLRLCLAPDGKARDDAADRPAAMRLRTSVAVSRPAPRSRRSVSKSTAPVATRAGRRDAKATASRNIDPQSVSAASCSA